MENPKLNIGDDVFDIIEEKTRQIADIKLEDDGYWYGYIVEGYVSWLSEKDAIWRNENYANCMYPPLYKVGDTIRIKANGKYGEIKEVHPSDRRSCISYTTLCRFDKKVGHVGESGIEKIDESLIPNPKFKIGETVFIPDSTEGGTVRAIEQHEGSYRYEIYYNDELSKKRGAFSYFSEKRLVTFDRISTNPKFSLESLNSKKMEELYYKVGDRVRDKATGRFGEVEYINKDVNGIPKGYSVAFLLYSKRRFYTNKDDIEKIEDYPIGNPKFKLQEVVCIPDSKGGIRGGKKKLDKFYPRSFNMGIKRDVYSKLNGFSDMRFGEDIDFSIRIFKSGYNCRLFPAAWVWHKRRTDFHKFWKQVFNSGIARINLYKKYPESLKLVHLLPMVFTVGMMILFSLCIAGIITMLATTEKKRNILG
jgi:hypothetical protein